MQSIDPSLEASRVPVAMISERPVDSVQAIVSPFRILPVQPVQLTFSAIYDGKAFRTSRTVPADGA
jgi:hypothetical protein